MELIRDIDENYKITNYKMVKKYIKEFMNEDREYFIVLGLDSTNKVLYRDVVTIGTLNSTMIHPREVFKKAIISSANTIICIHNHPSGSIKPSDDDLKISAKLNRCGKILDIKVIDHIIITKEHIVSFGNEI